MSYSLTLLRRRLEILENLPSARKPLVIRGGLPPDYQPRAVASPAITEVDRRGRLPMNEPKAPQPGAE
jgi:hypothetical protein